MRPLSRISLKGKILLLFGVGLLAASLPFIIWTQFLGPGGRSLPLVPLVASLTIGIATVLAYRFAGSITNPLISLTKLADDISQGNLDQELNFGKKVRCWEIKACRRLDCPAFMREDLICWFVDGTPCRDCPPRFPQKLAQCRKCFVYLDHRGDEVVQLADSIKNMVHQLKEARASLKRSMDLRDGIIAQCLHGIIASDSSGKLVVFNEQAARITSFPPEDILGKRSIFDLFPNPFREALLDWFHMGGSVHRALVEEDLAILSRQGDPVPVRASFFLAESERGSPGLFCFFVDLREIRLLREQLVKAERMALVGQISSTLSHSLRNMLHGLKGGSYIVDSAMSKGDLLLLEKGWEMIQKNIRQVERITTDLLRLSEDPLDHAFLCDLNQILEEAVQELSRRAAQAGVKLSLELEVSPLMAMVDPQAVKHALQHVLLNALESVEGLHGRSKAVTIRSCAKGDDSFIIQVHDNGEGIDEMTREKIFRDIFTTKGPGHLGLGLLLARRLVERNHGRIWVDSNASVGTCVTVTFPKNPEALHAFDCPRSTRQDSFLFNSSH